MKSKIKKRIITCNSCGRTRDYSKYLKFKYCTQCGHRFTFREKLYSHIEQFFHHK